MEIINRLQKCFRGKCKKHRMNWNLNRQWNTEICSRVLSGSWTVRRSIRMRLRTVTLLQWHRMIRMLSYLFSLSAKESFLEENIFIWKQMRKVQRKKFQELLSNSFTRGRLIFQGKSFWNRIFQKRRSLKNGCQRNEEQKYILRYQCVGKNTRWQRWQRKMPRMY